MTDAATIPTRFLERPDGLLLACRFVESVDAEAPVLLFLPGYMSDMAGGKAGAVFDWAAANGHACLLTDYSGCGQSEGDFADGTLDLWRDDVVHVVRETVGRRRLILIGSSMGGWLMLLIARALGPQVAAMIGIAAAPDFTSWGYSDAQKVELAAGRTIFEDNPYGPEPTPTHAGFWRSGEANLMLNGPIDFDGPVRLLQGQRDADVPWQTALTLADRISSDDVIVHLIKDGDHRLSRDADIARLLSVVAEVRGALA